MFKFIIPFVFFASFPLIANAQLLEPTEQPVIVKKTPYVIEEDSSEHNRMGKKYEVSLTPLAVGPIPGVNSGINVATYLTRNAAVVAGYTQLSIGRTCWGSLSCSDSGYSVEVYYRQFVSNSFYFAAGIDQRHVHIQGTDTWTTESYSFDGDTTALGFVIGNQWQWQSLLIGCDWIGINIPVATSLSNVQTTIYDSDFQTAKKSYVTNTTPMTLRFHIGMAF